MYEKNYNIGFVYSNISFVSVQGEEGSNPSIGLKSNPKGGIFMEKITKITFSLKFTLKIALIFNLAFSGNFLV